MEQYPNLSWTTEYKHFWADLLDINSWKIVRKWQLFSQLISWKLLKLNSTFHSVVTYIYYMCVNVLGFRQHLKSQAEKEWWWRGRNFCFKSLWLNQMLKIYTQKWTKLCHCLVIACLSVVFPFGFSDPIKMLCTSRDALIKFCASLCINEVHIKSIAAILFLLKIYSVVRL